MNWASAFRIFFSELALQQSFSNFPAFPSNLSITFSNEQIFTTDIKTNKKKQSGANPTKLQPQLHATLELYLTKSVL
jgi:hypothetical protein